MDDGVHNNSEDSRTPSRGLYLHFSRRVFWIFWFYLGMVTLPALRREPSVNQRELARVKSLMYSLSEGNLWTVRQPDLFQRCTAKSTRETARKMAPTAAQTSLASGDMKLRIPGFCFAGFLIMIEMPRPMKGAEKSTTRSLADVMVMPPKPTSVSFSSIHPNVMNTVLPSLAPRCRGKQWTYLADKFADNSVPSARHVGIFIAVPMILHFAQFI